jgi:thiol-disulfide isomerase/thioredoxin
METRTLILIGLFGIIIVILLYQVWIINDDSDTTIEMAKVPPKRAGTLVNYYASWCPASLQFMPVWDRFRQELSKAHPEIHTVTVQCDKKGKSLCEKAEITQYPSVILYKNGKEIPYTQNRTIQNLNQFIMDNFDYRF